MKNDELLDAGILDVNSVKQIKLLNEDKIFWLGILSIPANILFGIPGMILAARALDRATVAISLYKKEPDKYLESSFRRVQIGRRCAHLGLVLFIVLVFIFVLFFLD